MGKLRAEPSPKVTTEAQWEECHRGSPQAGVGILAGLILVEPFWENPFTAITLSFYVYKRVIKSTYIPYFIGSSGSNKKKDAKALAHGLTLRRCLMLNTRGQTQISYRLLFHHL